MVQHSHLVCLFLGSGIIRCPVRPSCDLDFDPLGPYDLAGSMAFHKHRLFSGIRNEEEIVGYKITKEHILNVGSDFGMIMYCAVSTVNL